MALTKMTYDELNQLVGYKVSEPFEEYYDPMRISEEQKRRRIDLAEYLDIVFIGLLSEYFYADQIGAIVASDIYDRTRESYLDAVSQVGIEPDDYIITHGIALIASTVEVLQRHRDDPYYYSHDRAMAISENESNSIWNHTEYEDAVKSKRHKRWRTIMDGHERDSHAEVNGVVLPINEPFLLRGGYVQFPRDDSLGVDETETSGCRCSLEFF